MSGQHDGVPLNRGEAALLRAAFEMDGELAKMQSDIRDALLESFAIHCQPMPDTYRPVPLEPIVGTFDSSERAAWRARYEMQRISTWPWVYAAAVLAARPGGAK